MENVRHHVFSFYEKWCFILPILPIDFNFFYPSQVLSADKKLILNDKSRSVDNAQFISLSLRRFKSVDTSFLIKHKVLSDRFRCQMGNNCRIIQVSVICPVGRKCRVDKWKWIAADQCQCAKREISISSRRGELQIDPLMWSILLMNSASWHSAHSPVHIRNQRVVGDGRHFSLRASKRFPLQHDTVALYQRQNRFYSQIWSRWFEIYINCQHGSIS